MIINKKAPNENDKVICATFAEIRGDKGLSRIKISRITGIASRLLKRYEMGLSRIPATHLWSLSRALKVPMEDFYAGIDHDNYLSNQEDIEQNRQSMMIEEIAEILFSISNPDVRKKISQLIKSL